MQDHSREIPEARVRCCSVPSKPPARPWMSYWPCRSARCTVCGVPIDVHLNHATSWFREERQAERRSTSLLLANHTRIDFFIYQKNRTCRNKLDFSIQVADSYPTEIDLTISRSGPEGLILIETTARRRSRGWTQRLEQGCGARHENLFGPTYPSYLLRSAIQQSSPRDLCKDVSRQDSEC
jgi:hypothetical protein